MHHIRKKNHRKMQKPKFNSSSDDDDDDEDITPMKWKPAVPSYSDESSKWKRQHYSVVKMPISDSTSKQQKLSAEVIEKEEMYNQAEMEANRIMFGSTNPGRCLSKDEIKRRKDIILQVVNERLKLKLSKLMGEFGERLEMNDSYDFGTNSTEDIDRFRNQSPEDDDDDDIPEAPPPPTFNTSSESSDEDLDISMTKEFEMYEKEIKEKLSSGVTNSSNNLPTSTGYASNQSVTSSSQFNIPQQTNYQQNWQQMSTPQWPTTDQSTDVWIPPVGPPQEMEPFLPPNESERIAFMKPASLFPTFPNTNPPAPGWMNPSPGWTNPSPGTFKPNYDSSVPQYSNNVQSTPFTPSIPPVQLYHIPRESAPRVKWNPVRSPTDDFNKPSTARCTIRTPNVDVPIVSKSTLNAALAAEQKVTGSTDQTVTTKKPVTESRKIELNQNANNHDSRKRSYEQENDCVTNSNFDKNSSLEFNKRTRTEGTTAKVTRFTNGGHSNDSQRNAEPLLARVPSFESNAKKTDKFVDNRNSMGDEPIEWRKLCDIVDKLLDISPDILKNLPPNDPRVKERNEILNILSGVPVKFYAHVDKYGEQNVSWAVKMAQRILCPGGRYDKNVALALAPFKRAIRSAINPSEMAVQKQEATVARNKVPIPAQQELIPKEWKKLCSIVDELLDVPTHVMETLPSSDIRVRERNNILMMLSNDPEDFLLHDDKYGARNVDVAILAAKRILCPDGVMDERVRKIMLRQREMLIKSLSPLAGRSNSRESEQTLKRSNYRNSVVAGEQRSLSMPKEWSQLCDIVDKVLDTPKEVRIKMSKRDPRWEQRDNLLLLLSDDPDKLRSQSDELGHANVNWAIKSSKNILFPHGSNDRTVFKKLSPQRMTLLRNRQQGNNIDDTRKTTDAVIKMTTSDRGHPPSKQSDQKSDTKVDQEKNADEQSPSKKDTAETEAPQVNGEDNDVKAKRNDVQKNTSNNSKKETTKPAAVEVISEKDVWKKLCAIVDKLLDLPPNAADKLEPLDKRLIERNDILMVLSDDPENFSKFESDYGSTNVAWAVNAAKKLIYLNGKPNEKFTDALWKERNAIMCSEDEELSKGGAPGNNEWICIRKIATKVFLLSCQSAKNEKKLSKEQTHQQIELFLQLSDDPDIVRTKPICKKIGEGRMEAAIARCKHLLNRMSKFGQQAVLNFEKLRSKMVLYSESLNQSKTITNYDVILTKVREIIDQKLFNGIYGQTFDKWTNQQKLERNELAIMLIKDPHLIESSAKYMEMVRKTGETTATHIVEEVKKCLLKCEYVREATTVVGPSVCAPIIAVIKDETFMNQFKEKKLIQRIHRLVEQFLVVPKPEIFDVRSSEGSIYVVCANKMTYDFLKTSIRELDGLWDGANLRISKAPPTHKVLDIDDLKEIKMTLKTVRAEPFAVVMKQLKKANAKLKTNKWQLVPASFYDPKKMFVMVDLQSLVELERSKREVIVECGTAYFDIKYFGKENF